MSDAAVMERPGQVEATNDWVDLDPPIVYSSQHAMRLGDRIYTPRQAKVIDLAVRTRRPLSVAPLPLDD